MNPSILPTPMIALFSVRVFTAVMTLSSMILGTTSNTSAAASLTFTINASPTADALGYVTSQTYNFVYTLNNASDAGLGPFQPGSASINNSYTWLQEWNFDSEVWTSVAGDGLAGSWVEPSASTPDPYSQLIASTSNPALTLNGGSDVSNVGLTAIGLPVKFINFTANYTGLNFSNITATLPDPNTYFPIYSGTYAADSTTTGWIHAIGGDAFFVVNSLTITSVPEPSSVTLLAVAFSALLICKRKRSQISA